MHSRQESVSIYEDILGGGGGKTKEKNAVVMSAEL